MSLASARFQLISGNRLDALAVRLGARLAQPPAGMGDDDLRPETVLVPQPALRHWLLQTLAMVVAVVAVADKAWRKPWRKAPRAASAHMLVVN